MSGKLTVTIHYPSKEMAEAIAKTMDILELEFDKTFVSLDKLNDENIIYLKKVVFRTI